jgi:hypothetical protein
MRLVTNVRKRLIRAPSVLCRSNLDACTRNRSRRNLGRVRPDSSIVEQKLELEAGAELFRGSERLAFPITGDGVAA